MAKARKRNGANKTRAKREEQHVGDWLVYVVKGPKAVIKFADADCKDDAIETYKELCGIVRSDHPFRAIRIESGHDLETDDKGIVLARSARTPAPRVEADDDAEESEAAE